MDDGVCNKWSRNSSCCHSKIRIASTSPSVPEPEIDLKQLGILGLMYGISNFVDYHVLYHNRLFARNDVYCLYPLVMFGSALLASTDRPQWNTVYCICVVCL